MHQLYRNNVLVLLNGKGPAFQAWVPVLLHLQRVLASMKLP